MSLRIVAACSGSASVIVLLMLSESVCCFIWAIASGARLLRILLKRFQSALLKLNCWHTGWGTVSSMGVVLNSNRMTSWSDPVVASSSTAQLVIASAVLGVAKVKSRTEVPVPFL